jgi:hypothetical protein
VEGLRSYSAAAVLSAVLGLSACGGGSGSSAPPAPVSVAFGTAPPATLVANNSASMSALVTNDSAAAGVKWTATCSVSQCGSFNPQTTSSGSATTYSPPAAVSAAMTVTLTATSLTDSSKSASASLTVTPAASAVLSDGTYIYHFSGQDDSGPMYVVGAFTVKNGVITGGEQDFGDAAGFVTNTLNAAGCDLSTAGNNVQVVLDTGNSGLGVNGVETLRGAAVSANRVLISEFDSAAAATGSLDLQTSTAQPSGGYAFVVNGWDNSAPVNQLAIGGILNFNGTALAAANSVFDINDGGALDQAQSFTSGSVSVPDNFGRVTFTLVPGAASQVPSFVLTGYIVGADRIELVESQDDALQADLGGAALGQGSNTGMFTTANVINTSYAHASIGMDAAGPLTMAGGFGFNADGTVSGVLAVNDLTVHAANPITAGSYTVDSTGRVTLGVTAPPFAQPYSFQLYLDGHGNALVMGMDSFETTAGPAFQQVASSPELSGTYAIRAQGYTSSAGYPFWGAVGQASIDSGNVAGFTDYTPQDSAPLPGVTLTGTSNSQNGLLTLAGLNALAFQAADGFGYYPIDSTRALAIEVGAQQLGLLWLEAPAAH